MKNSMTAQSKTTLFKLVKKLLSGYLPTLTLACVILIAVMAYLSPHFFSLTNFKDILLGTAVIGIISFGMTMVLISGDIDLSVGSVVAFSSVILCVCINQGLGLPMALGLTAAGAIAVGLVNGFFISVLEINSFIITLGSMSVVRGLAYIIIGGNPLPFKQPMVRAIGSGKFLAVPIPLLYGGRAGASLVCAQIHSVRQKRLCHWQ